MKSFIPATRHRARGQALATSTNAANSIASAVALNAGRRGAPIGRAFTPAGRAMAGSFSLLR
jgi:hypothetical protein